MKKDIVFYTLIILAVLFVVSPVIHGSGFENLPIFSENQNTEVSESSKINKSEKVYVPENSIYAAYSADLNYEDKQLVKEDKESEENTKQQSDDIFPFGALIMLFIACTILFLGRSSNPPVRR